MAEKSDTAAPPTGRVVVVTRVFDAPPERVFDAWLDPAMAGKWLFATAAGEMVRTEIDARVGGRFVFVDRRAGEDIEHTGEYLEIDHPRRLIFTFSVPKYSAEATRVTIDVAPHGSGCELTLTHEGVLPVYVEATRLGWTGILGRLAVGLAETWQGATNMAASNASPAEPAARTLVLTRVFDAPRELVFKMWTDPKHLARWWGPKGFTNPVCEADARPGGALRIVMRGPDGNEYPMVGVFREVAAPERLVFTNVAVDAQGNPILDGLTTVTFTEEGGKTKLTLETRAAALVPYAAAHLNGMEAGWTQSLERLAELVADADREILSMRVFDAPRELVFRAWTEAEHLARWWGPKGFTNTFHEFDPRPGGAWRFVMHGPDGKDYPNESVFVEIRRPERIVLDHVSRPRFRLTATFDDLGDKTRLVFHMLFQSAADCEKIKKIAVEGNEQNFDRLEVELVKMA